MKHPFIILLCAVFASTSYTQINEFDIVLTGKLWNPSLCIYNDASFDLSFFKETIYSYSPDGKLKETQFKLDSERKIDYKVRTLPTANVQIDYKTDTRYVLFPEYYGLSSKEDKRISGCGSILIEKLGTKGAEVTHALFEDPDCDNYSKGAYFMSGTDSYVREDGDPVFIVSMPKTSKSVTNPIKPEKGISENCVKRIILHTATNKVELSVHLMNKIPVCEEEYNSPHFIGNIDGKLYFVCRYTTPKTRLVNFDIWSVNESTLAEEKEYSYQVEIPKGISAVAGRMEVVSDPEKSGIAYHYGFGLWEGNKRSAHYKILEIHPKSEFKLTDLIIPDGLMNFGIAPPRLNYYDSEEATHFFLLTESDMLVASFTGSDKMELHIEQNINLISPSSAALFFDKRAASLREQYLKPVYENPEAVCKGCKTYKRGEYRLTGGNQATFVAMEYLKTCPTCEIQNMRVRTVTETLK